MKLPPDYALATANGLLCDTLVDKWQEAAPGLAQPEREVLAQAVEALCALVDARSWNGDPLTASDAWAFWAGVSANDRLGADARERLRAAAAEVLGEAPRTRGAYPILWMEMGEDPDGCDALMAILNGVQGERQRFALKAAFHIRFGHAGDRLAGDDNPVPHCMVCGRFYQDPDDIGVLRRPIYTDPDADMAELQAEMDAAIQASAARRLAGAAAIQPAPGNPHTGSVAIQAATQPAAGPWDDYGSVPAAMMRTLEDRGWTDAELSSAVASMGFDDEDLRQEFYEEFVGPVVDALESALGLVAHAP